MRVKHVQLRVTHKLIRERLVSSSTQRLQIAFRARTLSPGDPVSPVRELLAPPQNLVASTPRQRPLQLLCVNTRSQARPQTGSNRTRPKHTRGHMLVTTVAWLGPKIGHGDKHGEAVDTAALREARGRGVGCCTAGRAYMREHATRVSRAGGVLACYDSNRNYK